MVAAASATCSSAARDLANLSSRIEQPIQAVVTQHVMETAMHAVRLSKHMHGLCENVTFYVYGIRYDVELVINVSTYPLQAGADLSKAVGKPSVLSACRASWHSLIYSKHHVGCASAAAAGAGAACGRAALQFPEIARGAAVLCSCCAGPYKALSTSATATAALLCCNTRMLHPIQLCSAA